MTRQPVTSSHIAAVGYDADTGTLEVEFKPGKDGVAAVWEYFPVRPDVYAAMVDGRNSVGRLFAQHVRGSSLVTQRLVANVTSPPPEPPVEDALRASLEDAQETHAIQLARAIAALGAVQVEPDLYAVTWGRRWYTYTSEHLVLVYLLGGGAAIGGDSAALMPEGWEPKAHLGEVTP